MNNFNVPPSMLDAFTYVFLKTQRMFYSWLTGISVLFFTTYIILLTQLKTITPYSPTQFSFIAVAVVITFLILTARTQTAVKYNLFINDAHFKNAILNTDNFNSINTNTVLNNVNIRYRFYTMLAISTFGLMFMLGLTFIPQIVDTIVFTILTTIFILTSLTSYVGITVSTYYVNKSKKETEAIWD
jgi:hypothetical protein